MICQIESKFIKGLKIAQQKQTRKMTQRACCLWSLFDVKINYFCVTEMFPKSHKIKKSPKWAPGTSRGPQDIQKASKRHPKDIQKASKLDSTETSMQRTAKTMHPNRASQPKDIIKLARWRVVQRTGYIYRYRSDARGCPPTQLQN